MFSKTKFNDIVIILQQYLFFRNHGIFLPPNTRDYSASEYVDTIRRHNDGFQVQTPYDIVVFTLISKMINTAYLISYLLHYAAKRR